MHSEVSLILDRDAARVKERFDLSSMRGKRVLVSGASGLIGVNLINAMPECSITALVGHPPPKWIQEFFYYKGASVAISPRLDGDYDYIIHAAGSASPDRFTANPIETMRINTQALITLFDCLAPEGTLLYLSSAEVYVGNAQTVISEDAHGAASPKHPRACYIFGKLAGEAICHAMAREGNRVKIARVQSAYGPGTRLGDTRVLPEFVQMALRDGRVRMRDKGAQPLAFCYISDIVEMLLNILTRGKATVYNVGSPDLRMVFALAQDICSIVGCMPSWPENGESNPARGLRLDFKKYQSEFGKQWVPLSQGLRNTIEWYQALLKAESI